MPKISAHLPAFQPAEALEWWEESFTKDTVDSRLDFKAAEPTMRTIRTIISDVDVAAPNGFALGYPIQK